MRKPPVYVVGTLEMQRDRDFYHWVCSLQKYRVKPPYFSLFKSRSFENPGIFSSPEHEVLMVSYCDRAVSVVRRPSSTFYLVYALEATVLVGYS